MSEGTASTFKRLILSLFTSGSVMVRISGSIIITIAIAAITPIRTSLRLLRNILTFNVAEQ